ncbi:hypothetical protein NDU88_000363 [Pleurodeles waltl]|uniref:Uncharacterized protein n=1 Tax=Pleurodeles waltl TaxID=8319 RepID=A0AAV7KVF7_PLEWA|nr:hypothetical protein NDU88_000363 [Pleurodeles waltl]
MAQSASGDVRAVFLLEAAFRSRVETLPAAAFVPHLQNRHKAPPYHTGVTMRNFSVEIGRFYILLSRYFLTFVGRRGAFYNYK